jgi:Zn-dependent protease
MFGRSYKVGTLLGFRIEISVTFLILLGFILLSNGLSAGAAGMLGGLLMVLVLFGSVLAHELGHAVVARRLGLPILGIELHFVGGAAKMARPPRSARQEVVVAVAGPAVSFALGLVSLGLATATGSHLLWLLALINGMLGVFNLLPALPMDGGRVLRALLSERLGRLRATHVAASVAQGLAITMVVLGIVQAASPFLVIAGAQLSGLALVLVGTLVWLMAAQERRLADRWRYDDEEPAPQVLDAYGRVIHGDPDAHGATHVPRSAEPQTVFRASPRGSGPPDPAGAGPRRRVYRLPNGAVMVVEEHVRW